ncbi:MAG: hypothetical protein J6Y11_01450 [Paludibacteraceae bacterium]|nr:hypothetical protein [Paludibacteraceae bacterium]
MEKYFYILYIVLYAIALGISAILIYYLKKEFELYRFFSGDKEKMRALLAKDPKRFHISIVYLMTYLTRSNSIYKVQRDKLEMILRYIIEVIPLEYQVDAVKALKYLTDREKKSGKSTVTESIVDVKLFKKGKYQYCIKHGDDSYHYSHDIHGKRMAEELALYLPEDDRMYVMYLLYRLTILDGIITTDSSDSEMDMLVSLCVDGLKINKSDLDELIHEFATRKDQFWYDRHFAGKNDRYPSSNLLANVFRVDLDELATLKHKVTKTSFLEPIQNVLVLSYSVLFILFFVCFIWVSGYMTNVYSPWLGLIGCGVAFVLMFAVLFIKPLDSAIVPVLRTDIEDRLQRKGMIWSTILSVCSIFMLMFGVANFLLLVGNETFANLKDSFQVTVPVTGTHYSTHKNSTTYYVDFPEISFSDIKIPEVSGKKTGISYLNSLCLNSLPRLSGLDLLGIRYYKKKTSRSVPKSVYNTAKGKYIKLNFVVGYFGLVFHDTYQIVDHNDEENVVVDSESDQ